MDPIQEVAAELTKLLLELDSRLKRIEEKLQGFDLIQCQMSTIEHQLDAITALTAKSFNATLDPVAKAEERRRAEELAKKIADEHEKFMAGLLKDRAAAGIGNDGDAVTEADLEAADREFS